ncbi:MAG: type IV pilus assembly protein PilM [Acidimicrobiales bacterium]
MAHQSIGLDIGTSAIRAVELTVEEGRLPVIETFGQVGLSPGSVVAGEIHDRAQVSEAIGRLWREGHFGHRQVRVGVAGLRAIIREIDMPLLPPEELDSAVRFKADEVIPFSMQETVLSAKVIAQVASPEGPPMLRVLVGAVHVETVESLVATIESAGLEPVAIDLQTAAIARAVFDPAYQMPEAVVSIGAGLTMIVVHQMGNLQFVRTLDLGGETITDAIAGALDIPHRDAEAGKRRLSFPGTHDVMAAGACERAVGQLVNEINNSIRFFGSLPGRQPVGRIQLTGGGTRSPGLVKMMQDVAGVPVAIASPLSRSDLSSLPLTNEQAADVDSVSAAPIGLALPDPSGRPFNLLPESARTRALQKRIQRYLVRAAAVVVVLVVGLTAMRYLQVHSAQSHLAAVQAQNATIRNVEIPKYDKALVLRDKVVQQSGQVIPTLKKEVDWLVVLNQVAQYIPSNATLESITMNAAAVPGQTSTTSSSTTVGPSIGYISTTVSAKALTDVTAWGQSFAQSNILNNVDLSSGVSSGDNAVTFSATLNILDGAQSQRIAEYSVPTT